MIEQLPLSSLIFDASRALLALTFIGFVPGYAVVWAFLPQQRSTFTLQRIEVFFLSVLCSIALSTLAAFFLIFLGIELNPRLFILALMPVLILSLLYRAIRYGARPSGTWKWRAGSTSSARLGIGVLFALTFLVLVVILPYRSEAALALTEFAVAPQNLETAGVIYSQSDTQLSIPLVITNHNQAAVTYHIDAQFENDTALRRVQSSVAIDSGETWRGFVAVPRPSIPAAFVDLMLVQNEQPTDLSLRLWLTSEGGRQ